MKNQRRRMLMIVVLPLSILVIDSNFVPDQSGRASQGGSPMNVALITIDHVRVAADKHVMTECPK